MLDIQQIETFYPEHLRPFKRNLLREYLQYKILEAIFESPLANKLVFIGGTCIHIVHGSPRFFEDLEFDNYDLTQHEFETLSQGVKKALELQGYIVELKQTHGNTFRTFLRFADVLQDNNISGHRDEKLLIQIDTEAQGVRYRPDKFILSKFDVFSRINIAPADTLVSQKILCIFNRSRPMGRDFLDVIYLMGKSGVDYAYLAQKMAIHGKSELKEKLLKRSADLDFSLLAKDLEPFVYSEKDVERVLFFLDFVKQSL